MRGPHKYGSLLTPRLEPWRLFISMPYSVNGFGTTYYGHAEWRRDGSYITTEWIVFLFVPIIPLRSYRVKLVYGETLVHAKYDGYRVPLHFRQILTTYGVAVAALFGIVAFFLILDVIFRK